MHPSCIDSGNVGTHIGHGIAHKRSCMNWSTKPNHPGSYWIFFVPIMFPSGSQWVLNIYRGYMSRERRERERLQHILFGTFQTLNFFLKIVMAQSKMPITKKIIIIKLKLKLKKLKKLNFGGSHNKFKWVTIEFFVKLGNHNTRTLGLVPNRVRLKENLQKSTLAFKRVKFRNAPFFVVNWVSSYFDSSLSLFLSAPPLLLHIFSLILPVQLL